MILARMKLWNAQRSQGNHVPQYSGFADKLFAFCAYGFVIFFVVACVIPFLLVLSGSFTQETALKLKGFQLIPSDFTTYAYDFVMGGERIVNAYKVTVTVTLLGTALAMMITTPFSYVLAHRNARFAPFLSFMTYFTMIFGGGLIGFYILMARWLELRNTYWVMILPYLLNPFYAFILVAYFRTLPQDLVDAAKIDGASELGVFFRIALPLAKPVLASVSLFYALRYWNDWWLSLLFVDDHKLHSLQMMIRQLHSQIRATEYIRGSVGVTTGPVPTLSVQMATVILTIGPIVLVYPLVQRFFVKGMLIGAVKG